jgi:hypothetical protein
MIIFWICLTAYMLIGFGTAYAIYFMTDEQYGSSDFPIIMGFPTAMIGWPFIAMLLVGVFMNKWLTGLQNKKADKLRKKRREKEKQEWEAKDAAMLARIEAEERAANEKASASSYRGEDDGL